MRYMHALAALAAVIGAAASAPAPAQAADLVVQGRIGDVFVGVDTRDHFGRFDRHRHHRGHRRHFDPFDPRVDRDEFNERLERRFTYEKLFNGGSAFSHDRRRRALEGWPPPRDLHLHYHDHGGHWRGIGPVYRYDPTPPGVLLPEGHYLLQEDLQEDDRRGEAGGARSVEPAPEATARPAPDPRGPRRKVAAGAVPGVGERLPRGQPHVALDWQDYDLPEPPPGHGYVRFDGTVLLIEDRTRVVREVL